LKDPAVIKIDQEKAQAWLKKGAQLSETAKALFNKAGVFKSETVAAAEEGQ